MTVLPFSAAHLIPVLAELVLVGTLYFALRRRSAHAQFVALLLLMGLNIGQHFAKSIVWPHLYGTSFGYTNTAYNVCATLILASPFVFLYGSRSCVQFLAVAGTVSGLVPVLLPMRFWGETALQWEYVRSWTCHSLLAASSSLPILWKRVEFDFRDTWKFGFWFLAVLTLVLVNNCVFYLLFGEATPATLYEELFAYNPMQIMGPEPDLPAILVRCVPDFLLTGMGGRPFPVLWYAHLMYLGVSVAGIAVGLCFDTVRFTDTVRAMFGKKIPPPLGKRHDVFSHALKVYGGHGLRTVQARCSPTASSLP